jgi:hypothetical protein
MKLVIDIPEQMYLNSKKDMLCGADILVSAIKNGIPHETVTEFADRCRECGREKVLDKIRAEIEQELYVSKMEVLDIIDKYRAESEVSE